MLLIPKGDILIDFINREYLYEECAIFIETMKDCYKKHAKLNHLKFKPIVDLNNLDAINKSLKEAFVSIDC